jgi:hypothetical protein
MAVAKLLLVYAVVYTLFWIPSRILIGRLLAGRALGPSILDLFALVLSTGIGYATFWIYLWDREIGTVWSWSIAVAAAMVIAVDFAAALHRPAADGVSSWRRLSAGVREIVTAPVCAAFLLGVCYLGLETLYGGVNCYPNACTPGTCLEPVTVNYWQQSTAGDDLIPLKFALAVADGQPLRGTGTRFPGDWQYSDRPPVAVGVLLAFWPLADPPRLWLAVGVMLQTQWVVGLLALLGVLGAGAYRSRFTLLLTAASGCVFYNTLYTWPKFLATALGFAAAVPLVLAWRQRRGLTGLEAALAASAAALGLLSHGGIAFTLLAVGLLGMAYRRFYTLRTLATAIVVLAALYGPWFAYQKLIDPPGDRVVRLMLTAQQEDLEVPLADSVRKAYARLTFPQWLGSRWEALCMALRDPKLDHNIAVCARGMLDPQSVPVPRAAFVFRDYLDLETLRCDLSNLCILLRFDQIETPLRALGLLNLGWLLLVWQAVRSRGGSLRRLRTALPLAGLAVNVALWLLMVYSPEGCVIRNGSYGMLLLSFVVPILAIADARPVLRWTIAGLHLAGFFLLWVWFFPTPYARAFLPLLPTPHPAAVVAALGALAGFVFLYRTRRLHYDKPPAVQVPAGAPACGQGRLIFAGALALLMIVAAGAIHHRAPEGRIPRLGCVTPTGLVVKCPTLGVIGRHSLFDGIVGDPTNYAALPLRVPVEVLLDGPHRLQEIRLHLYDFDGRWYHLRVEARMSGQWTMLLDGSKTPQRGRLAIPLAGRMVDAVRVTGLYNSNQEQNPANALLHVEELELIPVQP